MHSHLVIPVSPTKRAKVNALRKVLYLKMNSNVYLLKRKTNIMEKVHQQHAKLLNVNVESVESNIGKQNVHKNQKLLIRECPSLGKN